MTAFSKDDIPNEITQIEQLHVWTSLALGKINEDITAIEGSGSAVPVIDSGFYDVPQTKQTRLITRTSFEVNKEFTYSGKKLWEEIVELSTNSLPSGFKSA